MSKANPNFFKMELVGVADLIYDALKKNDTDTLKGLQAFGISLWTWANNGAAIFSYIIRRTIEKRQKRKQDRAKWEKEKYPLPKEKREELLSNRIWFSVDDIRGAIKSMSTTILFLRGFKNLGFIEIINKNPHEYKKDPRGILVSLTPIWDTYLEDLQYKKTETEVFSESIGRLLALSVLARGQGPCGAANFSLLAALCGKVIKNNGEISIEECEEHFKSHRVPPAKMYQIFSYDSQRVREIRFIKSNDGKKIVLTQEAMLAYKKIHKRALELIITTR